MEKRTSTDDGQYSQYPEMTPRSWNESRTTSRTENRGRTTSLITMKRMNKQNHDPTVDTVRHVSDDGHRYVVVENAKKDSPFADVAMSSHMGSMTSLP